MPVIPLDTEVEVLSGRPESPSGRDRPSPRSRRPSRSRKVPRPSPLVLPITVAAYSPAIASVHKLQREADRLFSLWERAPPERKGEALASYHRADEAHRGALRSVEPWRPSGDGHPEHPYSLEV